MKSKLFIPLSLSSMCADLLVLNILVREGQIYTDKYMIYALKDSLIELLYKAGYCIEVVEHYQDRECWNCGGDGCFRCNDGVYSRFVLLAFKFKVGGRVYKWHIPKRNVTFFYELTIPDPQFYRTPPEKRPDHRGENRMLLNVWAGLKLRGVRRLPSFRDLEILPSPRFLYHYRLLPFIEKFFRKDDIPF